jgi:ATP-dependent DNA helicase PIF1
MLPRALDARLDPEQLLALEIARSGGNLFLTGGPGTGKSHTCKDIVAELQKLRPGGVMVVAPTGVAALPLGGQTMHSKPGPGVPKGTQERFRRAMLSRDNKAAWKKVKVLVLDEVSMVDAEFLDWFVATIREVTDAQLIFCGDFSQLPPVPSRDHTLDDEGHLQEMRDVADQCEGATDVPVPFGLRQSSGKYAFQSFVWRSLKMRAVELKRVHRTQDAVLLEAMTDMRRGQGGTPAVRRLVAATQRELSPIDGVEPTSLYPTRADVSRENEASLQALDQCTRHVFAAVDTVEVLPTAPDWTRENLSRDSFFKKDCQAPAVLELRVGTQVMMLINETDRSPGLVNGSRGVVIAFEAADGAEWPVVRFANGREESIRPAEFRKELYRRGECLRVQIPLMLAWAITIHKSQGMSIDYLRVDLSGTFADGQAYVAISRATRLEGLQIVHFKPSCVRAHPLALAMNSALEDGRLDEFAASVPTWWAPVVNHDLAWAELYCRNPSFAAWEKAYPQGSRGTKRKAE